MHTAVADKPTTSKFNQEKRSNLTIFHSRKAFRMMFQPHTRVEWPRGNYSVQHGCQTDKTDQLTSIVGHEKGMDDFIYDLCLTGLTLKFNNQ